MKENIILNHQQVCRKTRRIAYQIYEHNHQQTSLVLAGVQGTGYTMAQLLAKELTDISPIGPQVCRVAIDKAMPLQSEVVLDQPVESFSEKVVVLVDDVLNTGRTLAFCLKPFLSIPLARLQVAVLVDRSYPLFPVAADFTGYSLSTTVNQHIEADFSDLSDLKVYLY